MTAPAPPVPASPPGPAGPPASAGAGADVLSLPHREVSGGVAVASSALLILAALLLGFVASVVAVSQVQQARDQDVMRSDLRSDLANAVAPVGPTDIDGRPLAPGTPVGLLAIPALGVDQVVVSGTTSAVTARGPGHLRSTPLPGQAGVSVIYGRQAAYGGPFRDLGLLVVGDEIRVTTGQGEHVYAVSGIRRAGDPLPPALDDGEGRLTLVTADGTPYLPAGVLRVDARLLSPVQPAGGTAPTTAAEAPMAGEPASWLGVLLWGQALLLASLLATWAWLRWGRWQAWVVGVPVIGLLGLGVSTALVQLLPNLL